MQFFENIFSLRIKTWKTKNFLRVWKRANPLRRKVLARNKIFSMQIFDNRRTMSNILVGTRHFSWILWRNKEEFMEKWTYFLSRKSREKRRKEKEKWVNKERERFRANFLRLKCCTKSSVNHWSLLYQRSRNNYSKRKYFRWSCVPKIVDLVEMNGINPHIL